MVNMVLSFVSLILVATNWVLETIHRATILLALVVVLQVVVRGLRAKGPMDLDTFICRYLYHPLVVRFERHLSWVLWPRRRRGLAWLIFFVLVNTVLITTHGLSCAIHAGLEGLVPTSAAAYR